MPQNEFKVGDVVVLKSGGPKMTVYEVDGNLVSCQYWSEPAKRFEVLNNLDYAMLRKTE
jgi:uncharacterized protein YodC (DUF2158 family)